mmetsp:Transcript_70684/g.199532  ORF Transcript_70684/g.199532 Transcript_70684/m.199532 type:complete len:242 (-) Transcript_70684:13-738(-)
MRGLAVMVCSRLRTSAWPGRSVCRCPGTRTRWSLLGTEHPRSSSAFRNTPCRLMFGAQVAFLERWPPVRLSSTETARLTRSSRSLRNWARRRMSSGRASASCRTSSRPSRSGAASHGRRSEALPPTSGPRAWSSSTTSCATIRCGASPPRHRSRAHTSTPCEARRPWRRRWQSHEDVRSLWESSSCIPTSARCLRKAALIRGPVGMWRFRSPMLRAFRTTVWSLARAFWPGWLVLLVDPLQ